MLDTGATVVCCDEREASLRMAGSLLTNLGVDRALVSKMCREDREDSELRDILLAEELRRSKVGGGEDSIASTSGYRFNLPDSRTNIASNFLGLAKNQFSKLMSIGGSLSGSATDGEEDGEFTGEDLYSVAESNTLIFKEPATKSQELKPIAGIEGVDYCKLPDDGDKVGGGTGKNTDA